MAIVEDYVPDSDDEEMADPSVPIKSSIPDRAVKQQQLNGQATKGSSITELIEQLRVPEAFNDTLHSSQLSEWIIRSSREERKADLRNISALARVESHQRRIRSALEQLSKVLLPETGEEESGSSQDVSRPEIDVKVLIAVARLRGIIKGPDGALVTPEILQLVEGRYPLPRSLRCNADPSQVYSKSVLNLLK